jgi:hypothetical protein
MADFPGALAAESGQASGRTAQLIPTEYDEALRVVKAAFGALAEGEIAPQPQQLALDDLPAHEASGGAPRLVAFGRLRGVGAVSHEHELRFAPGGLTVIYGQNAAGKTTYVRALKRVCRTVDCEAEVRGTSHRSAWTLEGKRDRAHPAAPCFHRAIPPRNRERLSPCSLQLMSRSATYPLTATAASPSSA